MAADWIKLEKSTPDKPEIHRMAVGLGLDPDAVMGKLVRLWAWLDGILQDRHARSVTNVLIDRITFCDGFADALVDVGWLEEAEDGFSIPNFERHMSKCAKRRALDAERQRQRRDGGHGESVTSVTQKPNQRREEKSSTPIVPKGTEKNPLFTDAFERFWAAYPRKVGKLDAAKKFKRLKCAGLLEQILRALQWQQQTDDWKKEGGEFIPHPATWLNQGRWEDDPGGGVKTEKKIRRPSILSAGTKG